MAAVGNQNNYFDKLLFYAPAPLAVAATVLQVGVIAAQAAASPYMVTAGIAAGIASGIFVSVLSSAVVGGCTCRSRPVFFLETLVLTGGFGIVAPWKSLRLFASVPLSVGFNAGVTLVHVLHIVLVYSRSSRPNRPPAPAPLSTEVSQLLNDNFGEYCFYRLCDLAVQEKLKVPILPTLITDPRMARIPAHRIYDLLLWANGKNDAAVLKVCREKFPLWNAIVSVCESTDRFFEGAIARGETKDIAEWLDKPCLSSFCLTHQLRGLVLVNNTQLAEIITTNRDAFDRIPREKRNALFPPA